VNSLGDEDHRQDQIAVVTELEIGESDVHPHRTECEVDHSCCTVRENQSEGKRGNYCTSTKSGQDESRILANHVGGSAHPVDLADINPVADLVQLPVSHQTQHLLRRTHRWQAIELFAVAGVGVPHEA
jgi:hypothetical protein